jgi:hypothetical protein
MSEMGRVGRPGRPGRIGEMGRIGETWLGMAGNGEKRCNGPGYASDIP